MKRIAIIIELKERELSFLSILKKKLEFNGYNVRLIPQRSFCGTRLLFFKPDFILINGLRSKYNFIKQILVPKILFKSKIISFYTEQVGKDGGLAKTYDNPEIFNNVDYHITWGEKFAEGLINLGINKEKIWILGSFALDLPFFQDVEKSNNIKNQTALKYGLDKKKKWILIADNIIRKNKHPELYNKRRDEFNQLIKSIAQKYSNVEIVFRPHPDTAKGDLPIFIKCFKDYDNIKIISGGHIFLWIKLSKAMIIWRSTSSVEAWRSGLEIFCYRTSDKESDYWHEDFIPSFDKKEDLISALEQLLQNKYVLDSFYDTNRKDYVRDWFYSIDGLSFDRFAAFIKLIDDSNCKNKICNNYSLYTIFLVYVKEVLAGILSLLNKQYKRYNVKAKEVEIELSYFSTDYQKSNDYSKVDKDNGNYLIQKQ
jgi:hypothetical protein